MERRRYKRYNARNNSVILSKGNSYAGSIQNVSKEGLAYIMSTFIEALEDQKKKLNSLFLLPQVKH
jgi:hypothetical protein